jgi:hypothetical protein
MYLGFVYHPLFEPLMKIDFHLIHGAPVLIEGCKMVK